MIGPRARQIPIRLVCDGPCVANIIACFRLDLHWFAQFGMREPATRLHKLPLTKKIRASGVNHATRVATMKEGQNMLTEEQKIAQAEKAEQAFHCLQIAILNIAGSIASGLRTRW